MPILSSLGASSARGFGFRAKGGLPQIVLTISANTTNYNVLTAAGSPAVASEVIVNINSGVTVGGTSGNTALTVGQFPTGSTITINNSGSIEGYFGAAGTSGAGGAGGDAINANYANQTVVINNNSGAYIRAGGGGGGKGGKGGAGGQGSVTGTVGSVSGVADATGQTWCNNKCASVYGAGITCQSGCIAPKNGFGSCSNCYGTTYTNGGAGGSGGSGGVGQGYANSQSNGSSGSAGATGGTNAGTGGTGGTGGNGGTWGTAGSSGSTGSTGANGNYTNGSSGSGGSAGGAAGRYLVKGSNDVTLNNSGTLNGGTA